jgi:antitoxin MazE
MNTTIQKWGNSQGLRLPKALLEELRIEVGSPITIEVREGSIVLTPVRKERPAVRLEDLVAAIPQGSRKRKEVNWGPPSGREEW